VKEGSMTALPLLLARPRNMYWLRISVERLPVGGAQASSARAVVKGSVSIRNRVKNRSGKRDGCVFVNRIEFIDVPLS